MFSVKNILIYKKDLMHSFPEERFLKKKYLRFASGIGSSGVTAKKFTENSSCGIFHFCYLACILLVYC